MTKTEEMRSNANLLADRGETAAAWTVSSAAEICERLDKILAALCRPTAVAEPPAARITADAGVCHGAHVFAGTRVPVHQIVAAFGAGDSIPDLVRAYGISGEDIRGGIALAAEVLEASGGCSPEDVRQALGFVDEEGAQ